MAGKVKFVGFDASPKLIDGLERGRGGRTHRAEPAQDGRDGREGGRGFKIKRQERRGQVVDTGVTFVSKANMATPDVAALIAPPKI